MAQNGTHKPTDTHDQPGHALDLTAQGVPEENALTGKQFAALPYLVASPTLSEGARLADVGRSTLYRWLDDPDFRDLLERRRADAANLARAELQGLMLKGAIVLADSMESPNPMVRLRAARTALYVGLKASDIKDIRERLDRLDDALTLLVNRSPRR